MSNPLAIGSIAKGIMGGLDALFTSDEERAQAELAVVKELNQPHIMQAMITLQEAKHPSAFVSGWRPALGWLCVILLAYAWIGRDAVIIGLELFGKGGIVGKLPQVDAGEMLTLVFALLGLGATRSYEKMKGVARHR